MTHTEFMYKTEDGADLYEQTWLPDSDPKAVICLIHGLGEHSTRYEHVANYYTSRGYIMTAFDLRGHGKSSGQRGHYPSLDAAMNDIDSFIKSAEMKYPGMPVILYGHSLGGVMVLNYALRNKNNLTTVIATSPGLATGDKVAAWKLSMGKLLYSIMPTFSMPNGLDVDNISRDRSVVEKYQADPLVHDKVTARFGLDFINAGAWALEHANEFSQPLLLLYGTDDHIVSGDAIRKFATKAPNVTFKEWDGGFHELHNEPIKEMVFEYTEKWIQSNISNE